VTPADDLSCFRPNVGVILFRDDGKVWLGRRAGTSGPLNWQFPQGGVDAGEDLQDAALRELAEETGVHSVQVLGRTPGWIAYAFPEDHAGSKIAKGWKGQKQVVVRHALHRPGLRDRSGSRTARSSSTPGAGPTRPGAGNRGRLQSRTPTAPRSRLCAPTAEHQIVGAARKACRVGRHHPTHGDRRPCQPRSSWSMAPSAAAGCSNKFRAPFERAGHTVIAVDLPRP